MAISTNAGRIQGLTVQIGGDTTQLTKALSGVNKDIKTTQTALKDVEKLLKLDPTNTELLEQKQKLLNNAVDETTEKLKTLRDAEQQLKDAGIDENSEQFMGLRREIIDTEAKLKDAEKASKEFNVSLEKASVTMSQVSDKASQVAQKTKALSTAGAAVAGGLTAMAVNSMKAADDLNTLAKQSGFSTEELQKFQYASEMVDVSTEDIIGSVKKLRKNMASDSEAVTSAWEQLGISVRDTNGEMRDSTEVFYETLEALSQVENETVRDQLAMDLFGRSADNLAGIIDDGGKALKQYGDEAEIWSQESIDAANAVNDQVDQIKADIQQTILTTGAKVLEQLAPIIETIVGKIGELLEFIGSLDSDTLGLILTIASVIAAISPVAGIIAQVSGAISSLISFAPTLISFLTSPVGLIAAIVTAVTIAVVEIVKHWDEIKAKAKEVWEAVKENFLEPIKDAFEKLKEILMSIWDSIVQGIKNRINGMIKLVNGAINGINKLINSVNNVGTKIGISANIPTIPNIPLLANGGTLSHGSAIVGEAGAELLSVNGGRATVQPLTNSTTINNITQASSRPIELTIQLDRAVLARQLYTSLNDEGIRRGTNLVGV